MKRVVRDPAEVLREIDEKCRDAYALLARGYRLLAEAAEMRAALDRALAAEVERRRRAREPEQ